MLCPPITKAQRRHCPWPLSTLKVAYPPPLKSIAPYRVYPGAVHPWKKPVERPINHNCASLSRALRQLLAVYIIKILKVCKKARRFYIALILEQASKDSHFGWFCDLSVRSQVNYQSYRSTVILLVNLIVIPSCQTKFEYSRTSCNQQNVLFWIHLLSQ